MKYIISLGGSIIVPSEIDIRFVKNFITLVKHRVKKGDTFFIVTGGGAIARKYVAAAKKLSRTVSNFDLDWMGISATKLNAQLLNSAFGKFARKGIINDPSEAGRSLKKVNIVSGWKPGWSTDYVAVRIAQTYGVKTVINLSNIAYVYEADPRYHKQAKRHEYLTWQQFLRQFGQKWRPGINLPFDPVGAQLAQKLGIRVVVMGGQNLKNFENFLRRRHFHGTVIE